MLSRVPDATWAKGEGKLQDEVLRPLNASSPAVIILLLSMMLLSPGVNACGGPRGAGNPLFPSIMCANLGEIVVRPWEGCFQLVTTSTCVLCMFDSDRPEIL